MTSIRSILLAALMVCPATAWSQVFTSPQPGVLRGVGLAPGMQRGNVSSGLSVPPQNYQPQINQGSDFRSQGQYGQVDGNQFRGDQFDGGQYRGERYDSNDAAPDAGQSPDRSQEYGNPNTTRNRGDFGGPATEGYGPRNGNTRSRQAPVNGPRINSTNNRTSRPVRPVLSDSVWKRGAAEQTGYFAILGAIAKPAVYAAPTDRLRLIELVKLAGGTTDPASGGVRIVRQGRAGLQTFLSPDTVYEVLNGDVVIVEARRAATKSGLQEFSQPLRSLSPNAPTGDEPDSNAAVSATSSGPSQAYLAFTGIANRPVIVPVPSNEATLKAAMLWLKLDPASASWPRILAPTPLFRAANGDIDATQPLPSGTVLAFEPSTINPNALPELPPAVGVVNANPTAIDPNRPNQSERVQAPLPRRTRTDRPNSRTNQMSPDVATAVPPQEGTPSAPGVRPTDGLPINPGPTGGRLSRPRTIAPDAIDAGPIDAGPIGDGPDNQLPMENAPQRTRPRAVTPQDQENLDRIPQADELSFQGSGPAPRTRQGGPLLFAPRTESFDRPQANSPDAVPFRRPPFHSDSNVTPADLNADGPQSSTPAGFEGEPAVIPNGSGFGRQLQHEVPVDEPLRLDEREDMLAADAEVSGAPPVSGSSNRQNASRGTSNSLSGGLVVAPWYSSTIGMFWIGSSSALLVLAGLWSWSRSSSAKQRIEGSDSLSDLLLNRLPILKESVRPPRGLKFQGRPAVLHAGSTAVPAPHMNQAPFQQPATVNSNAENTARQGKPASHGSRPAAMNPSPGTAVPRTISEQERLLRSEFQQARTTKPQQNVENPVNAANPAPAENSHQAVPAPHFASRAKVLSNVPRNNSSQPASTRTPLPIDDSATLGRALTNRKQKG